MRAFGVETRLGARHANPKSHTSNYHISRARCSRKERPHRVVFGGNFAMQWPMAESRPCPKDVQQRVASRRVAAANLERAPGRFQLKVY